MKLRPYQERIIFEVREQFKRGNKSVLVTSPTGSGKTLLTAFMLKTAAEKGISSIFLVHRRELVTQSSRAFESIGLDHGVISAGFEPDYSKRVQIASVQTLTRRLDKLIRDPGLVVFDEAHHTAATNWDKLRQHFSESYIVGLTATPARLDGKGLRKYFSTLVYGPSVAGLISAGHLADYKYFAPPSAFDPKQAHTRMGDYVQSDLALQLDKPKIAGDAVNEYIKRAAGKRAIVFCINIEHSKHVRDSFISKGIPAEHVDGTDSQEYRDSALARLASGETKVITSVDIFGEGLDVPGIEVAILMRPTKSLGLFIQQVGRALRPAVNKSHAIIIDHANNCMTHGLPDDEREWSLDGINKSKSEPGIKICHSCFAASPAGSLSCRTCGLEFPKKKPTGGASKITSSDQSLQEIDKTQFRKSKVDLEKITAKTKDDLTKLAIARGYKHPHWWAQKVFQARQAKKIRG